MTKTARVCSFCKKDIDQSDKGIVASGKVMACEPCIRAAYAQAFQHGNAGPFEVLEGGNQPLRLIDEEPKDA